MTARRWIYSLRQAASLAILLVGITIGTPATAQFIDVRGGEHADFTRLVLEVGGGRDWALEDTGDRWEIRLTPGIDGFDLSSSFDLIPRTRIADLDQDGDTLILTLACACGITASRYADAFLVIDVSDDTVRDGQPDTTRADPESGPDTVPASAAPVSPERQAERAAAAAALPDLARLLSSGAGTTAADRPDAAAAPAAPEPPPTPRPDLEEAARIMAEQLSRAAAAGLLEPAAIASRPATAAPPPGIPPSPMETAPDLPAPDIAARATPARPGPAQSAPSTPTERDSPTPPVPARAPGVLARNAFDIARAPRRDPAMAQPPLACSGAALAIGDWAEHSGLYGDLGALRGAVFDERDRIIEETAIDLAKHYLHHGFGAEALFWLSQLDDPPAHLGALGHLVDGMATPHYGEVTDDTDCSDEEFLLRYLAGAAGTDLTEPQAFRLQRGYALLPAPLRARFGADLARQIDAQDYPGPARNIRDMLMRSGLLTDPEMLALDMDLGFGPDGPQLREALSLALRDDGVSPAATMARALALDRRDRVLPGIERVTAAMALLRETPGGAEADLLWREVVIAQAAMGQVDTALSMILAGRDRAPELWQGAVTDLVADRLAAGDEAALLVMAHLLGADWTAPGSAAGRIRTAAARFLSEKNLTGAATQIARGRPILTVPRPQPPPPPPTNGWAEGDWRRAIASLDGPHREIATRMAGLPDPDTPPPASAALDLDRVASRIADSATLRQAARGVLAGSPGARDAPPGADEPGGDE